MELRKAFYRLFGMLELHWIYTKKIFYCLLVAVGAIQLFSLYRKLNDASYFYYGQVTKSPYGDETINGVPRFEEYLAQSKWDLIFSMGLIAVILILISGALQQRSVSRVTYTFERLPVSEGVWYSSMILHHILVFCIYLGAQMLFIFIGYWMYRTTFPGDAVMIQSLFLAFVRWDFLRSLYPVTDPIRLAENLILLVYMGSFCTHQMICLHYKINSAGVWIISILMGLYVNINTSLFTAIGISLVCILASIWMIYIFRNRKDLNEMNKKSRNEEDTLKVEVISN